MCIHKILLNKLSGNKICTGNVNRHCKKSNANTDPSVKQGNIVTRFPIQILLLLLSPLASLLQNGIRPIREVFELLY